MIKAQPGKPRCRRFGPAGEPGSWVGKICSWLQIFIGLRRHAAATCMPSRSTRAVVLRLRQSRDR
jgi:hypothetical protein